MPIILSMRTRRPGRPAIYLSKIIALKPKKSIYFAGANMASIKAIVCRTAKKLDRTYSNRSEDGGVVVYRES